MKNVLLLLSCFVIAPFATAQNINWVTMDEALALQKKNPKKIFVDVYTNWCGPCKMLDKNTFSNKDVISYMNENYYAVKFNAEGNDTITYKDKTFTNPNYNAERANRRNSSHQFSRYMRISAFPTVVFFDENGEYIVGIPSYMSPQQIELYLKLFKNDKYKEMTTQKQFNAYYESFKPTFK